MRSDASPGTESLRPSSAETPEVAEKTELRDDTGGAVSSPEARAIARAFDSSAPGYEADRLASWYKAQGSMVLREVGTLSRGRVVDIGCGTGWLLRQLLRHSPRLRGIGIDVSEGMVNRAREKAAEEGIENIAFLRGDWERMPLDGLLAAPGPGGGVDGAALVTCVSAFHYFRDPLEALRRMRSVLDPGGRILLLDRDKGDAPMTAALDLVHRCLVRDHCRFYRGDQLEHLLACAGFTDVRVEAQERRMFWHGKALSSLILISAVCADPLPDDPLPDDPILRERGA